MTLTRRRFLTIAAAFAAGPAQALSHTWQGRAFGAEISIRIQGPRDRAEPALREARQVIAEVERLFSLYAPESELVRLNRTGHIRPKPQFLALMRAADHAHHLTDGLFDPTVQPLWSALRKGTDPRAAAALIGWHRVTFDATRVTLAPGQLLTFNGIAQGFATDRVADIFRAHGIAKTLINIGEYHGTGGPHRLGLTDPTHGRLATLTLQDGAVATSSPSATPLGLQGHILHAQAVPQWSTVMVEAATATLADALSTALVLAPLDQIAALRHTNGIRRIMLVNGAGEVTSL